MESWVPSMSECSLLHAMGSSTVTECQGMQSTLNSHFAVATYIVDHTLPHWGPHSCRSRNAPLVLLHSKIANEAYIVLHADQMAAETPACRAQVSTISTFADSVHCGCP